MFFLFARTNTSKAMLNSEESAMNRMGYFSFPCWFMKYAFTVAR